MSGISIFLVEKEMIGVKARRLQMQGSWSSGTSYITFDNVKVPVENLIGNENGFNLDDHHYFETNKPMLVCGNTASMLQETWLSKYFDVFGSRKVHYGLFDCSNDSKTTGDNSCGSGGTCC